MRCGHMRRPAFWSLLLAALCAATCATPAFPAAAARSSLADAVTTTPATADSSLAARPHASLAAPDVGHAQLREQLRYKHALDAARHELWAVTRCTGGANGNTQNAASTGWPPEPAPSPKAAGEQNEQTTVTLLSMVHGLAGSYASALWRNRARYVALHRGAEYCQSSWRAGALSTDRAGRQFAKDHASWSKLVLVREVLHRSDWVLWLDADAIILSPSIDMAPMLAAAAGQSKQLVFAMDPPRLAALRAQRAAQDAAAAAAAATAGAGSADARVVAESADKAESADARARSEYYRSRRGGTDSGLACDSGELPSFTRVAGHLQVLRDTNPPNSWQTSLAGLMEGVMAVRRSQFAFEWLDRMYFFPYGVPHRNKLFQQQDAIWRWMTHETEAADAACMFVSGLSFNVNPVAWTAEAGLPIVHGAGMSIKGVERLAKYTVLETVLDACDGDGSSTAMCEAAVKRWASDVCSARNMSFHCDGFVLGECPPSECVGEVVCEAIPGYAMV